MRSSRAIASVVAALGFAAALHGQQPSFEVASVRHNVSGGTPSISAMPNGRFSATNAELRSLILRAYGLHDSQLIGAPEWIASERFDIDARAASAPADGPEALMPMLRTLLTERFNLRAHTETRELPAYVLVVARRDRRLGPQIRPTEADCTGTRSLSQAEIRASARDGWPPCGLTFTVNFTTTTATGNSTKLRIRRSAISMKDFATTFQATVGRPVLDRTGLEGKFDVEYSFAPQPADPGAAAAFGPEAPGVLVALEEQLGLKLDSQRSEVPVLVLDSVDRPTET